MGGLPRGLEFEQATLGAHGGVHQDMPEYLEFDDSLRQVVRLNWANYKSSLIGEIEWHNPAQPSMGMTSAIWRAVWNNLPEIDGLVDSPLNLYTAVGRTSLDCYHGVDMFFWWHGVYVTVDLALYDKEREGRLKADLLLSEHDLQPAKIDMFGLHVALFLQREVITKKMNELKRRRQALHFLSDYLR